MYISDMYISKEWLAVLALLVAGVILALYIMRRRSRLGRRTPKF